jgi:hypothetical protein
MDMEKKTLKSVEQQAQLDCFGNQRGNWPWDIRRYMAFGHLGMWRMMWESINMPLSCFS